MYYVIKHSSKGFYDGRDFSDYSDAFFFNSAAQARLNMGRLIEKGEKQEELTVLPCYGLLDANYIG